MTVLIKLTLFGKGGESTRYELARIASQPLLPPRRIRWDERLSARRRVVCAEFVSKRHTQLEVVSFSFAHRFKKTNKKTPKTLRLDISLYENNVLQEAERQFFSVQ